MVMENKDKKLRTLLILAEGECDVTIFVMDIIDGAGSRRHRM